MADNVSALPNLESSARVVLQREACEGARWAGAGTRVTYESPALAFVHAIGNVCLLLRGSVDPVCHVGYLFLANTSTLTGVLPMARKRVHRYPIKRRESTEVSASIFKDSCLQLLDRVGQTREEIVVTKYGRPVAKLVAFEEGRVPLFGHLAGSVTFHGDVVAPLNVEWDAES